MIHKNKGFIITIFIIIQIILFINNNQKTSFRYFTWNIQEIKIGKLIAISFVSGLFISTVLNNTKKIILINNLKKKDEYYEDPEEYKNEEQTTFNPEMPPQRDIRETQPTISVNYRVIKNNSENNIKYEEDLPNKEGYQDDWINDEDEW